MAQSVKLKDGSYLDASGVYDTALEQTQREINEAVLRKMNTMQQFLWNGAKTNIIIKIVASSARDKNHVFIFGNANGKTLCSLILSNGTVLNLGLIAITASYDASTATYTLSGLKPYSSLTVIASEMIATISYS